jgi:hypothetical protein
MYYLDLCYIYAYCYRCEISDYQNVHCGDYGRMECDAV